MYASIGKMLLKSVDEFDKVKVANLLLNFVLAVTKNTSTQIMWKLERYSQMIQIYNI